jgi:hypothetical protein
MTHAPRLSGRYPQKGLAFRSKSSMCVLVAPVAVPRAATPRPDVFSASGARLSEGPGLAKPSSRRKARNMSTKLTDNQHALLESASLRGDRCFVLPPNLKGGAAQKVMAKLIAEGLAKKIKAKAGAPIWRRDGETDQAYSLKLSAAGAKAIAATEHSGGKTAPEAPAQEALPDSMDSATTSHQVAEVGKASPREGSKLASVIALLRRPEGATIVVLTKATGWLPHTTRAAITGVRKRGYSVVLDRGAEGASVYRLSDPRVSEAATSIPQTEEKKPARRQREAKVKAVA